MAPKKALQKGFAVTRCITGQSKPNLTAPTQTKQTHENEIPTNHRRYLRRRFTWLTRSCWWKFSYCVRHLLGLRIMLRKWQALPSQHLLRIIHTKVCYERF